jgi:hypothetical protein
MIRKPEWLRRYRQALVDIAGMSRQEAFDHLVNNKNEFDYGYSPEWYVREEMACGKCIAKVIDAFDGTEVH